MAGPIGRSPGDEPVAALVGGLKLIEGYSPRRSGGQLPPSPDATRRGPQRTNRTATPGRRPHTDRGSRYPPPAARQAALMTGQGCCQAEGAPGADAGRDLMQPGREVSDRVEPARETAVGHS